LIVQQLNEKFGKSWSLDKCKPKIKHLMDKYKEKKNWDRKQSGGSIWKSPFYDELDTALGTCDTVTFQQVAQTWSHSPSVKSSDTSSPADKSLSVKEENSGKAEENSEVIPNSRELRRQRKKAYTGCRTTRAGGRRSRKAA